MNNSQKVVNPSIGKLLRNEGYQRVSTETPWGRVAVTKAGGWSDRRQGRGLPRWLCPAAAMAGSAFTPGDSGREAAG